MVGFEPTTPALRKLCSTVELHRRPPGRRAKRQLRENGRRIQAAVQRWPRVLLLSAMQVLAQRVAQNSTLHAGPIAQKSAAACARKPAPQRIGREKPEKLRFCKRPLGWNDVCTIYYRTNNGAGDSGGLPPPVGPNTPVVASLLRSFFALFAAVSCGFSQLCSAGLRFTSADFGMRMTGAQSTQVPVVLGLD